MTKLLFFDIDGTLAYPGQTPPMSAVDAIRNARKNGHKAFLSTGRTIDSIPQAVADIGFDGGIFSSGGVIVSNDTILAQHFMCVSIVQAILSLLLREGIFFILETPEGRYNSENGQRILSQTDLSSVSPKMQQLVHDVLFDPTAIPYERYIGQPVYKIAYYSADRSIASLLSGELKGLAKVVPFDNIPGFPLSTGEISDPMINKGSALESICRHLGLHPASSIAFGDSMNDAEILSAAGLGVAMGNADPQLKNLADVICDSCENDGIAKTLFLLNLI